MYGYKVIWEDKPSTGGALVVSNHVSFLDPPLVGCAFKEKIWFLARSSLHKAGLGFLIKRLQTIPVQRGAVSAEAFKKIVSKVKAGEKVLLFPEGTRSPDGNLQSVKPGLSLLLSQLDCPLIPAYVEGAYDIWGRHKKWPACRGKVTVVIGKPLSLEPLAHLDKKASREKLAALLKEEWERLRQLAIDQPN